MRELGGESEDDGDDGGEAEGGVGVTSGLRRVGDPADWDAGVLALAAPHVLQSWAWGELKARWGWQVERRVWPERAGGVAAAAQILTRRIGRAPLRVGYIPKGPLLARPDDPGAWDGVLADLEAWARDRGLVLLKMDADMPAGAEEVVAVWRARGWRPSAEQIQFPNTMISDLGGGEAAVWAALKPDTRRKVRLAQRQGVTIRQGGIDDLAAFHALYAATGARQGFGIRARDYYLDAWSMFLDLGRATVILAEREGAPLAGVIPVAFGPTVWYLYGASADAGREHRPAYLAQWESLRWAMARGATRYDWWGGPTVLDAHDPLWGVYRFKSGFGARMAWQQGAWDYPCGGWRHAAYRGADRLRRAWIARRGG